MTLDPTTVTDITSSVTPRACEVVVTVANTLVRVATIIEVGVEETDVTREVTVVVLEAVTVSVMVVTTEIEDALVVVEVVRVEVMMTDSVVIIVLVVNVAV